MCEERIKILSSRRAVKRKIIFLVDVEKVWPGLLWK